MSKRVNDITIQGARIGFRNFSGAPGKYNAAGDRNFCLFIDKEFAEVLERDGWNIKWLQPREEGDEPQAYLQVTVRYDNIPPRVVLVTGGGKTLLDEESVSILDWADIEHVDIKVSPYHWEVSGKSGIKAYLKVMYITIREDEFADKYRDIPDSAQSNIVSSIQTPELEEF